MSEEKQTPNEIDKPEIGDQGDSDGARKSDKARNSSGESVPDFCESASEIKKTKTLKVGPGKQSDKPPAKPTNKAGEPASSKQQVDSISTTHQETRELSNAEQKQQARKSPGLDSQHVNSVKSSVSQLGDRTTQSTADILIVAPSETTVISGRNVTDLKQAAVKESPRESATTASKEDDMLDHIKKAAESLMETWTAEVSWHRSSLCY